MKLRNKRPGELKECVVVPVDSNGYPNEYQVFEKGESLAELNEEWEDVPEEPKEYWYISDFGYVFNHEINNKSVKSTIEEMKSIGNYFLSREEAELAVRKLKAWKRLKDKGFRFTAWYGGSKNISYEITSLENETYIPRQICDDLDLLFGDE